MPEFKVERKILDLVKHLNNDIQETRDSLTMNQVKARVKDITKESNLNSKLKKTGIALLIASHLAKKRESASLRTLSLEARKIIKEIEYLRL